MIPDSTHRAERGRARRLAWLRWPTFTGEQFEGAAGIFLVVGVGAAAAVFSWSNVLALAARVHLTGWRGWVVAACVETLAIAAGLEARRRHRHGQPLPMPVALLIVSASVQLAAQIAEVDPEHGPLQHVPWGYVLTAIPACTFLILVKLIFGRSAAPGRALADALARAKRAEQEVTQTSARAQSYLLDQATAREASEQAARDAQAAREATAAAEQRAADAEARAAAAEARAAEAERAARDAERRAGDGRRDERQPVPPRTSRPASTTTDADRRRIIRQVLAGDEEAGIEADPTAGKAPLRAAILAAGHTPGGNDTLAELIREVKDELAGRPHLTSIPGAAAAVA